VKPTKRARAKSKPVEITFLIKVRRTATVENSVKVQAADRKAAEKEAPNSLRSRPFEVDEATIKDEIAGVK
jgi:hypothetical protein